MPEERHDDEWPSWMVTSRRKKRPITAIAQIRSAIPAHITATPRATQTQPLPA